MQGVVSTMRVLTNSIARIETQKNTCEALSVKQMQNF
jgi:hypothetical protein